MKYFILVFLIFLSPLSLAAPNPSVFHAHDGRIHQHPLPKEGIAHRHSSGAKGTLAKSTNRAGTISSSVTYEPIKSTIKPPKPTTQNNGSLVFGNTKKGTSPFLQPYTRQLESRIRFTKGDTRCRRGQADCNVCAVDVQQQFQKASSGRINWRSLSWQFNWPQRYAPYGVRPLDIFDGDPAYALGIPDTHVQGFVRTNSYQYPYAGTKRKKKRGGVFVVQQQRNGERSLSSLHQANTRHPSGVQVIGKYLVYAEGDQLIFKDLDSHQQKNNIAIRLPKPGYGGGLAVLKISNNNHLIVTSGPGGQKAGPRYNRFYHLKSKNGRPVSLKLINQSASTIPQGWPRGLAYSENLSLITECGTGDIYAVHTSGDEKGVSAIRGNGYWRLSRLMVNKANNNKLSLKPISGFSNQQNMSSCNVRAAATTFVNPEHQLEFYCHGYAKDPDGSLFNVLGKSSRGVDKFKFKVGKIY